MQDRIRVAGTAVVLREGGSGLEILLLHRPTSGSFPGAWVLPGGRVDSDDWTDAMTEADAARNAAVRETAEEAGLRLGDITLLSRWSPPEQTPVRFRTWFFLARDPGEGVRVNPGEIEEAVWMTPEQVFAGHADGSITLFAPTWVTLHGLLGRRGVDEALAAVGEPEYFATHMQTDALGQLALWAGDEEHPSAPGEHGMRHRLRMGAPPWHYQRTA